VEGSRDGGENYYNRMAEAKRRKAKKKKKVK